MSELQAAMGLAVLPYMDVIFEERKKVVNYYNAHLNFKKLKTIKIRANTNWNYSYYPIIFNTEVALLKTITKLNENNIFPRRYFYPSLNTLNYVNNIRMPISDTIAKRVLFLPLYKGLSKMQLNIICTLIKNNI